MGSRGGVEPLEERVRETIRALSDLNRGAPLEFALGVGRVVVETLYGGDPKAWRTRARKNHALRTLAARPDLPLSVTALYRALAIYELSHHRPEAAQWQHLGVSHLRAVLGLPEAVQHTLLSRAEAEQWTAARLEKEALGRRAQARPSGGRKPVPRYVKSLRRILELTSAEALEGLELHEGLEAAEVKELADKLQSVRRRLDQIEKQLARQRSEPERTPRGAPRNAERGSRPGS